MDLHNVYQPLVGKLPPVDLGHRGALAVRNGDLWVVMAFKRTGISVYTTGTKGLNLRG